MISTMKQATRNIFSRLNWKVYGPTLFTLITLLSIIPCWIFLPERFAWENHLIENAQLLILAGCFWIAVKSKSNKKLFNWVAMIAVILFLREINCGRIFFPRPRPEGMAPTFYHWYEIIPNYWWRVPNAIYACFLLYAIYYFFKSRLYKTLWDYAKFAKIDCINIICLFIGLIVGSISESRFMEDEMLEELTETLFYVSFTVLVYLYSRYSLFSITKRETK